jgi:hypothetical protein
VALAAPPARHAANARLRALVFVMHLLQPLARGWGRLQGGLGPFRWTRAEPGHVRRIARAHRRRVSLRSFTFACWGEQNQDKNTFLRAVMSELSNTRCVLDGASGWEDWDVQLTRGLSARARILVAPEYHGGARVLLRSRVRLGITPLAAVLVAALLLGSVYLWLKDFGLGIGDTYLDALGLLLPMAGVLGLAWQRAQLSVRIDEALQRAAETLHMQVIER